MTDNMRNESRQASWQEPEEWLWTQDSTNIVVYTLRNTNGTSQNLENVQYEASNNSDDTKSQMQTAISPAKTGCLGIDGRVISSHPQELYGSVRGALEHTQTMVTSVYSSMHKKQHSEKKC